MHGQSQQPMFPSSPKAVGEESDVDVVALPPASTSSPQPPPPPPPMPPNALDAASHQPSSRGRSPGDAPQRTQAQPDGPPHTRSGDHVGRGEDDIDDDDDDRTNVASREASRVRSGDDGEEKRQSAPAPAPPQPPPPPSGATAKGGEPNEDERGDKQSRSRSRSRNRSGRSSRSASRQRRRDEKRASAADEALADAEEVRREARRQLAEMYDEFCVGFEHRDEDDPRNMSEARKWFVYSIYLVTLLWANAISAALAPAVPQIAEDLGVSVTAARSVQAIYLYSLALGAVVLTPVSEDYGRWPTHVASVFLLGLFQLPCALAPNFGTLLAFRALAGFFAASCFNSVGVVADIWPSDRQGWPVNAFAIAAELGACLGPVFGGYLFVGAGWRWSFGVFGIVTAALLVVYFVAVRETRAGVILTRRAARVRNKTGDARWFARHERVRSQRTLRDVAQETLFRPVFMLFTEPIVFWFALFDGFNYAIVYLFLEAFGLVYGAYGFSLGAQGLPFLGLCVGFGVAFSLYPLQMRYEAHSAKRNGGVMPPEATLGWCVLGGLLFPVSLFWFAWTSRPPIPWIVSVLAAAGFGVASHTIFIAVSSYTILAYQLYSASAVGAQSLLRELLSGSVTYAAEPMYDRLGYAWASSLLGFVAAALAAVPVLLFAFGPTIRRRSRFYREILVAEAKADEERRLARIEWDRNNTIEAEE